MYSMVSRVNPWQANAAINILVAPLPSKDGNQLVALRIQNTMLPSGMIGWVDGDKNNEVLILRFFGDQQANVNVKDGTIKLDWIDMMMIMNKMNSPGF